MDIFFGRDFAEGIYQKYPIRYVDVGASGGIKSNWSRAAKNIEIIGFEPDDREFDNLEKCATVGRKYLQTFLYEEKTKVKFNLARKQRVSSLYQPNRKLYDRFPHPERFDIVEVVELDADTLDNQLQANGIDDVDFIKLDTQGSELHILKGAAATLDGVLGMEVEVEFVEEYVGQPMFGEVDQFIRPRGFNLLDLELSYMTRPSGRNPGITKGQLFDANALYVRDIESLASILVRYEVRPDSDQYIRAKILKCMSICCLYPHMDYALEILDVFSEKFSVHEREKIISCIRRSIPFWRRILRESGMSAALYSLYRRSPLFSCCKF